jgi:hypothetical protein
MQHIERDGPAVPSRAAMPRPAAVRCHPTPVHKDEQPAPTPALT